MKALAWDDETAYLTQVATHLESFGIVLELTTDEDEFIRRYRKGGWEFVITDLIDEGSADHRDTGLQIARQLERFAPNVLVFLVTKEFDRIDRDRLRLPNNVIPKSKSTHPGWMAGEIHAELVKRG